MADKGLHNDEYPVPPGSTLWRFMSFAKFVAMLDSGGIYLARADLLGDPVEGVHSMPTRDALKQTRKPTLIHLALGARIVPAGLDLRKLVHVSCWHMGADESTGMWSQYVRAELGVAVRVSVEKLCRAIEGNVGMYIAAVEYLDYKTELTPLDDPWAIFVTKRKQFWHEREARIISAPASLDDDSVDDRPGWTLQVDLDKLIDEIRVCPGAPEWFRILVGSVSRRFGVDARVNVSSIDELHGP